MGKTYQLLSMIIEEKLHIKPIFMTFRTLEATEQVTYKESGIRMTLDFSL